MVGRGGHAPILEGGFYKKTIMPRSACLHPPIFPASAHRLPPLLSADAVFFSFVVLPGRFLTFFFFFFLLLLFEFASGAWRRQRQAWRIDC